MLARAGSLGSLFVASSLWAWQALAQAPAPVPTAKKVITTQAPPAAAAAVPAPAPAPASPAPAAIAALATPPNTVERARQGVVVLERQGKPLALGVVLEGDGRILTALSPLTNGNFVGARYHDGKLIPLKLVHSDRGWDLALLSPTGTPKDPAQKTGLKAAKQPSFTGLQSFAVAPTNKVVVTPTALKLAPGWLGADSIALNDAYELGSKPVYVGGPVVNSIGEVVALVARGCPPASGAACVPTPYGAPVSALRHFLQSVPAQASWLGIEAVGDATSGVRGVRVAAVIPDSPAASAGFRPGKDLTQADLIVAVDGAPVASLIELNEAVRAHALGDSIEVLLFGMGRYRHVSVKPRPAPELVKAPYLAPKLGKPRTPNPYR